MWPRRRLGSQKALKSDSSPLCGNALSSSAPWGLQKASLPSPRLPRTLSLATQQQPSEMPEAWARRPVEYSQGEPVS